MRQDNVQCFLCNNSTNDIHTIYNGRRNLLNSKQVLVKDFSSNSTPAVTVRADSVTDNITHVCYTICLPLSSTNTV